MHISTLMGVRALARHLGVDPSTVSKAAKAGGIPVAEVGEKGPLFDPKTAARAWAERYRPRAETTQIAEQAAQEGVGDPAAPIVDYTISRAKREMYEAEMARLEYETKAGILVRAEDAANEWHNIVVAARTRLMGVPSKAKVRMPELSAQQVDTLDALIREALDELANMAYDDNDDAEVDDGPDPSNAPADPRGVPPAAPPLAE